MQRKPVPGTLKRTPAFFSTPKLKNIRIYAFIPISILFFLTTNNIYIKITFKKEKRKKKKRAESRTNVAFVLNFPAESELFIYGSTNLRADK